MSDIPYSTILLSNGSVALVSNEDFTALNRMKWYVSSSGYVTNRNQSATDGRKKPTIRMHNEVMKLHGIEIPEGQEVDHINTDRLDNRFENLRLCTRSQNIAHRPYKNKTGFRGVVRRENGKYRGSLEHGGKHYNTIQFDTPEDAARARDAIAKEFYGEFATLNFPA